MSTWGILIICITVYSLLKPLVTEKARQWEIENDKKEDEFNRGPDEQ